MIKLLYQIVQEHRTSDGHVPHQGGSSLRGLHLLGAQATTIANAKAFGYTGAQIADNAGVEVESGITKYEYNGASRVGHY